MTTEGVQSRLGDAEIFPLLNVLVLGGSGFVGRSVCERLFERSGGVGRIVAPTRRPARARHLKLLPTAEIPLADVHDDNDLARLLSGCDVAINLVGVLHGRDADFERAHVALPERLARACRTAGVRRVIHVSALGAAADAPSRYLRSKAAGEERLRSAALDLTLLRPSVMFGEHDRFLNLFARLQAVFPVLPLAAADAQFQPVWVDDVASAIVRSIDERAALGQSYECCGPKVYTLKQLAQLAGSISGHPRPVIALPRALGRLQAALLELLPGEPLMSRDNLDSMRSPNIASGRLPGIEQLGIVPSPVESIAPLYLGDDHGPRRLDAWRAEATRA